MWVPIYDMLGALHYVRIHVCIVNVSTIFFRYDCSIVLKIQHLAKFIKAGTHNHSLL